MATSDFGTLIEDVALLHNSGIHPILVHGGGPEISEMLERLGQEARFVDGLRVTDDSTIRVVEMVLGGSVNKRVVQWLEQEGAPAVGLSGKDGGMLRVRPHERSAELGFVGEVERVETAVLDALIDGGFVPVVASLGMGPEGATYNLNGDTAASALAVAVGAEKLLLLTDVPGVLRPRDDGENELLTNLAPSEASRLIESGVISSGMIPKVKACLAALDGGVVSAHVLAASRPHGLLVELFTYEGVGTMISEVDASAMAQDAHQDRRRT